LDLVAVLQGALADGGVVDEGAVRRAEVGDDEARSRPGEAGVAAAHGVVVEGDGGLVAPPADDLVLAERDALAELGAVDDHEAGRARVAPLPRLGWRERDCRVQRGPLVVVLVRHAQSLHQGAATRREARADDRVVGFATWDPSVPAPLPSPRRSSPARSSRPPAATPRSSPA